MNNLLDELSELTPEVNSHVDINNINSTFICEQKKILDLFQKIQNMFSYIWLIDISIIEKKNGNRLLKYVFVNFDLSSYFSISCIVDQIEPTESVAHMWRNAVILEQEIFELFGIQFTRDYEVKYPFKFSTPPMLKNFKSKNTVLVENNEQFDEIVFPKQSLIHNQIKFKINTSDDLVNNCTVSNGNFHIGLEKIIENASLQTAILTIESYFPRRSIEWGCLLSKSIEQANQWEIPGRAKALRMVFLELSRIFGHINFLTHMSYDLELSSLYSQCLLWNKRLQSLFISFSGNEFGQHIVRPGGVIRDASQVWLSRALREITIFETSFLRVYKNLLKNSSFKANLDFTLITKTTADLWGVTGPLARSVGINVDLRKVDPFYFYRDVEFDIPIGAGGKAYDLLIVKVEEVFQSLKIIIQVLDNLPTGPVLIENLNPLLEKKKNISVEAQALLRNAVSEFMQVNNDFCGFNCLESSSGALSLTLDYFDEKINRIKFGSQQVVLKSLFERCAVGRELTDIDTLWTMFNIDLKEVER